MDSGEVRDLGLFTERMGRNEPCVIDSEEGRDMG